MKENNVGQSARIDREIKFRAWDTVNNRFIEIENIQIARNNKPTSINDGQYQIQSNGQIILLQYTGLKDKNEIEIYEGDIVNIQDQDYTADTLSVVQFISNGFDLDRTMRGTTHGGHNLRLLRNYITVVGNIYQNPELL